MAKSGELGRKQADDPTLADAIDKYIEASRKTLGRTKLGVLAAIKTYDIASMKCSDIGSKQLVALTQELQEGRKPQTVSNYLSHLSAVFAIARPAWGIELDQQAMKDTFAVAKSLGLTGKSQLRTRRPTMDELDKLLTHFQQSQRRWPKSMPMTHIIVYALFSTRRQEEITRALWTDLDREGSRILVRDMKNPDQKQGNDIWVDLPAEALRIIDAMPRKADQIFPYNSKSISVIFGRACKLLDIVDLHFHDLRHEGVSRLFEMGLSIPRVAAASGHRSWAALKGYEHMRQVGDKYAGWTWLDTLAPAPNNPRPAFPVIAR